MTTKINIGNSARLQAKKPTLLIYDQNPYVGYRFKNNLTDRGFDVVVTSSYEDCLQQFYALQPHAVLLDLDFFDASTGISLLWKLRIENPDVPIMVMAAGPTQELVTKCDLLGANAFIQKPFVEKAVRDAMTDLMDDMKKF
jgi:CheY-like chemotaxis protein